MTQKKKLRTFCSNQDDFHKQKGDLEKPQINYCVQIDEYILTFFFLSDSSPQVAQRISSVLGFFFFPVHSYSHISNEEKPEARCSHLHSKAQGTFQNWYLKGNINATAHITLLTCGLGSVLSLTVPPPTLPSKKEMLLPNHVWRF